MRCPHCALDINDPVPECSKCGFHIRQLDEIFGAVPEKSGNVLDQAGVLSADGIKRLSELTESFQRDTGFEFHIVTRKSTAPRLPAEYVFWLFNRWQIGGESHSGVLILLALDERRIESEIGWALEDIVTDEASTLILQRHAVPFFVAGKFDDGLYHSARVLAELIRRSKRAKPPTQEVNT